MGFYACTAPSKPITPQQPFFDFAAFFTQEAQRLSQVKRPVQKTVLLGKDSSSQRLERLDWDKELGPFQALQLNKPLWLEHYKVDSLRDAQGQLLQLRYQAQKLSLPIQAADVHFEQGQPLHFSFVLRNSNALYEAQEYLSYHCQKGYTLRKEQDIRYWDQQQYQIRVDFLP